jgi:hypothetical protein
VTSNLPFEDWTSIFGSERLTGALLDRLTHHVHILEMNGDSYRLKQSRSQRRRTPPRLLSRMRCFGVYLPGRGVKEGSLFLFMLIRKPHLAVKALGSGVANGKRRAALTARQIERMEGRSFKCIKFTSG